MNFFSRLAIFISLLSKYDDLYQPTVNYSRHSHGCTTWCILAGVVQNIKLGTVYLVTRLALLELATIPVLLWPEEVRGSCSVCVT